MPRRCISRAGGAPSGPQGQVGEGLAGILAPEVSRRGAVMWDARLPPCPPPAPRRRDTPGEVGGHGPFYLGLCATPPDAEPSKAEGPRRGLKPRPERAPTLQMTPRHGDQGRSQHLSAGGEPPRKGPGLSFQPAHHHVALSLACPACPEPVSPSAQQGQSGGLSGVPPGPGFLWEHEPVLILLE